MTKTALVPIADGTEELEAVSIIDILRRAEVEVTVASVADLHIEATRGTRIVADCLLSDCEDDSFDVIAIPGGMPGSEHLRDSEVLTAMLKKQASEGGLIAAVCAAPAVVLGPLGLLAERSATCHPSFADELPSHCDDPVVVDENIITSQGAGTSIPFALKLVELLFDGDRAKDVATAMCFA